MVDVCHSLAQLRAFSPLFQRAAIAVGNFDGVHRGHAHILQVAAKLAADSDADAVALTFDPHPRAIVGDGAPPALTTAAQRRRLMRNFGIEATVSLHFDRSVADLSPEQFVEEVLVRGLGAIHIVVGDNFRFGHRARGTPRLLAELGERFGYSVHTAAPVSLDGQVISSSLVRKMLSAGDVAAAARLLGRNYDVTGTVVRGEGRGATLGFPTANVAPEEGLLVPGVGVYLARAVLQPELAVETPAERAEGRPALAVVSDKPTFGYGDTVLEVHVLDYDGKLLDQSLRVEFLDKLRDVVRFNSVVDLQQQIRTDVEMARRRFQARAIV